MSPDEDVQIDIDLVVRNLSSQVADLSVKLAVSESVVQKVSEQNQSLTRELEAARALVDSVGAEATASEKKENGNAKRATVKSG